VARTLDPFERELLHGLVDDLLLSSDAESERASERESDPLVARLYEGSGPERSWSAWLWAAEIKLLRRQVDDGSRRIWSDAGFAGRTLMFKFVALRRSVVLIHLRDDHDWPQASMTTTTTEPSRRDFDREFGEIVRVEWPDEVDDEASWLDKVRKNEKLQDELWNSLAITKLGKVSKEIRDIRKSLRA
jgi:hypothetical protein